MKKSLFLLLLFPFAAHTFSQSVDYIVRTLDYKTPVTAVAVSPDRSLVLGGLEDGRLVVLDAGTFEEKFVVKEAAAEAIFDIEMSPEMDLIFVAAGNRIYLYDSTGVRITSWGHHRNTIWSMDLHPSGKTMASTEVNKTFFLVDVFEGKVDTYMRGHDDITFAVAFSPDGKLLASGSSDKEVFLWDMETKAVIAKFRGLSGTVYDVAFSPDGSLVAACSEDESVRIWDIATGKLVHLLKGHQEMVLEIEFSPCGKYLLSASADQSVKLWELSSGEQLYAYLENGGSVPDIAFLPGGSRFVSAGMDGTMKVWGIHPEIFVVKYFRDAYEEELQNNPLFLKRQKGEKRSDYLARQEKAAAEKEKIINRYYQMYLESKHLE